MHHFFTYISRDGDTIAAMAKTAAVALSITFFILANMKFIDRNTRYYFPKIVRYARSGMKKSNIVWPVKWTEKADRLKESQEQDIDDLDLKNEEKSNWWYFWFWVSYLLMFPAGRVSAAVVALTRWKETQVGFAVPAVRIVLGVIFLPICVIFFILQVTVELLLMPWSKPKEGTKVGETAERGKEASKEDKYRMEQQDLFKTITDHSAVMAKLQDICKSKDKKETAAAKTSNGTASGTNGEPTTPIPRSEEVVGESPECAELKPMSKSDDIEALVDEVDPEEQNRRPSRCAVM